jgi:hypothetical protein
MGSTSVRGCIERIELQRHTASFDDVVNRSRRDDYYEAGLDRRVNTIENCLPASFLDAKELVELVDFLPDIFLGL